MDRGAWRATVHGVTKSWIWLSDWVHTHTHTHTHTHSNNYLYWTLTIGQDLEPITSSCHWIDVSVNLWKLLCHVWFFDPMDYIVHRILQARILEWVALPFSRRSSQPRDQTQVSCIVGKFFTSWATREAQGLLRTSLVAHMVKNLPANTGNLGLIPGSGRFFGEGSNNPLQWRIPGEFLGMPGEFHGQRSLVRYSSWGHKESDTTEQLSTLWVYLLTCRLGAHIYCFESSGPL